MGDRTFGQKVGQWLNNWVVTVSLISSLGGAAIYGNSETVKGWVHSSPLTVHEVTPEVNSENYDRVLKEIIKQNKGQNARMDGMQKQININKDWHE